jgi:hypothetical protein
MVDMMATEPTEKHGKKQYSFEEGKGVRNLFGTVVADFQPNTR